LIRVTGIVRGASATDLRARLPAEARRDGRLRVELRRAAIDPAIATMLGDARRLLELRRGSLEIAIPGAAGESVRPVVLPAGPEGSWQDLTYAEQQVARFAGEGLTSNAVAATLGVSPHTVSAPLRHVFEKPGINSRASVARLVIGLTESA
jgi:DNA-binding CsgD family transcriptional regulator